VSQGKSLSGETIYYGMEVLDNENIPKWLNYAEHTRELTGERGLLVGLAQLSLDEVKEMDLQKFTGFNDLELASYMNIIEQVRQKNPELAKAIRGVGSGIAGFVPGYQRFVAYISKQPITGKFDFSNQPETQFVDVKTYNEIYKDILMSVGVNNGSTHVFENRGIFRNPASFLSGGHKNMSLMLHGFTAAVMSEFYGAQYFIVTPVKSMHTLLAKTIPSDQMLIAGDNRNYGFAQISEKLDTKTLFEEITSEELIEKAFQNPTYAPGEVLGSEKYGFEKLHLIKIAALIELYNQTATKKE
jgi:hypothetical protein